MEKRVDRKQEMGEKVDKTLPAAGVCDWLVLSGCEPEVCSRFRVRVRVRVRGLGLEPI